MARLADIQAARLAGALLTGDAVKGDAVKGDAPFTLISRRKVRFWIGASATLAAIILVSWKVESHDPQSSGLSLGALSHPGERYEVHTSYERGGRRWFDLFRSYGAIDRRPVDNGEWWQWALVSGGTTPIRHLFLEFH